jgi:hypothetical protein
MTAGERLASLAGIPGAAGVLLLAIGAGVTAGAALVDYSRLGPSSAADHLLAERTVVQTIPASGSTRRTRHHETIGWRDDEEALLMVIL